MTSKTFTRPSALHIFTNALLVILMMMSPLTSIAARMPASPAAVTPAHANAAAPAPTLVPVAQPRARAENPPSVNRADLAALASPLSGTRWYFAAQAAGAGARQLLYILNPNAVPAPVTFTYYRGHTATPLSARLLIPAASTAVEDVGADIGPRADQGVSIVVNSPRVISVARVLRRAGAGGAILNADITPGVMAPARQWLFAEGYIGLTYHEYLTLFNPNPASARVTVRFAAQGASVPAIAPVTLVVPALGQALLDVGRAYRRASVKSVGLLVTSDAPIVTARTLYWGQSLGQSQFGADARSGAPAASTNWDFAGVSVSGDDQPFLTVLAPRGVAHITAWLHAADGRLLATMRMRVASGRRATLRLLIRQQAGLTYRAL